MARLPFPRLELLMIFAAASIPAQAFRFMELAPISSFGDDTPHAQDAADQYPIARRMCLEACDWSFASRVAALPPRSLPSYDPDPDLHWAFAAPGDCVRLIEVGDPWVTWRRDGNLIRADQAGPLRVRYTADVTDEGQMPALFQTAVALRLAALLAPMWVGSDSKTQSLDQRAALALQAAMRTDARQASQQRYDGRSWGVEDWGDYATGGGDVRRNWVVSSSPVALVLPSPAVPTDPAAEPDYVEIFRSARA